MSKAAESLDSLLRVMRRLRNPDHGCAWDRAQDFASIAPYTLEEAYEVVDAIDRQDLKSLRTELGDLLFQVVFHAQMAEEAGAFSFADVAGGIAAKLIRRHPHVFDDQPAADWEALKAEERAAEGKQGALDGIALALPALTRAAKLGKRAARVNFDWQCVAQVREKIAEELAELDCAVANGESRQRQVEEFGDCLFACSQWARYQGIDPEAALRQANQKFARRFAAMERIAAQRGWALGELDSRRWDELWMLAKEAT